MEPVAKNWFARHKRIVGIVAVIGAVILIGLVFLASLSTARYKGISSDYVSNAPTGYQQESARSMDDYAEVDSIGYYQPIVADYVPALESYETTNYSAQARVRDLESACAMLSEWKIDPGIHFKYLNESKNSCGARFFVEDEAQSLLVRDQLETIKGIAITRTTESVTRRRSQLSNQSALVAEHLASVEGTLEEAKRQYADITEVARAGNDATALTTAIRDKIEILETLTQRRISLTSQLQQLEQQAADLEEQIGVTAFTVTLNRSFVIDSDRTTREWENAWQLLKEQFTAVLIGFSAYLGVFILRALQLALYGIVLLVIVRLLYRLMGRIWRL